ncbi:hypothetical protein Q8F55_000493 [Vanrija albida]|uniref:PHD-type domain-containing protein n=1 Tax=Vanrija albida TaxID=181172 RepID=A0ABR3QDF0_9TREE
MPRNILLPLSAYLRPDASGPTNGQKNRANAAVTDLLAPHILRSICHVKVTKIIAGSNANYALALDVYGVAHLFGKLPTGGLGPPGSKGIVPHDQPLHIAPHSAGLAQGARWVDGSVGRSHFFLIDNDGGVWGCGNNVAGQLGLPISAEEPKLVQIKGPWVSQGAKIVQVSTGLTFSLFLTDSGQVYAAGSSEFGQLGNGTTGERLVKAGRMSYEVQTPPRQITEGLGSKKVVQISSGSQHSLALDDEGNVWAWGHAGYARLGLGDTKDRLVPTIIPQYQAGNEKNRAVEVLCGPTSSIVIDRHRLFHIAGKWKLSGDGSAGTPHTYFKTIENLSCITTLAAVGGCTHFITTPMEEGKTMTIGWGQGALYGELAFGNEKMKSSTKPQEIVPLRGIDVIDVAAGCFFTLFLAQPTDELSDLPRYPEHIESADVCLVCNEFQGEDEVQLECERCDEPYHPGCLDPPLDGVPSGQWFCPVCEEESEKMGQPGTNSNGTEEVEDNLDVQSQRAEPLKRKGGSEANVTPKKVRAE